MKPQCNWHFGGGISSPKKLNHSLVSTFDVMRFDFNYPGKKNHLFCQRKPAVEGGGITNF